MSSTFISLLGSSPLVNCSRLSTQRSPTRSGLPVGVPVRRTTGVLRIQAAAAGGFNPFRDKKKEDAAKKALEGMFKGKKDIFEKLDKQQEASLAGGGGGRSGGFGGGSSGGGGSFGDFREWGDKFGKGFKDFLQTLATIWLFLGALSVFYLWQPFFGFVVLVIRTVLRLDARGARRARPQLAAEEVDPEAQKKNVGETQKSVISKYGSTTEAEVETPLDEEDL